MQVLGRCLAHTYYLDPWGREQGTSVLSHLQTVRACLSFMDLLTNQQVIHFSHRRRSISLLQKYLPSIRQDRHLQRYVLALGSFGHVRFTLTANGSHCTVALRASFLSFEQSPQRTLRDTFPNGECQMGPQSQQICCHFVRVTCIAYIDFERSFTK